MLNLSLIFSGLLVVIILCSFEVVVFGQSLDKTYASTECGLSILYSSNWKTEEINDEADLINHIVEIQPNTDEGFRNVLRIELDDISSLSDRSFQGIKEFEEESLSTLGDLAKNNNIGYGSGWWSSCTKNSLHRRIGRNFR